MHSNQKLDDNIFLFEHFEQYKCNCTAIRRNATVCSLFQLTRQPRGQTGCRDHPGGCLPFTVCTCLSQLSTLPRRTKSLQPLQPFLILTQEAFQFLKINIKNIFSKKNCIYFTFLLIWSQENLIFFNFRFYKKLVFPFSDKYIRKMKIIVFFIKSVVFFKKN